MKALIALALLVLTACTTPFNSDRYKWDDLSALNQNYALLRVYEEAVVAGAAIAINPATPDVFVFALDSITKISTPAAQELSNAARDYAAARQQAKAILELEGPEKADKYLAVAQTALGTLTQVSLRAGPKLFALVDKVKGR